VGGVLKYLKDILGSFGKFEYKIILDYMMRVF
jgi:hypothetical protein